MDVSTLSFLDGSETNLGALTVATKGGVVGLFRAAVDQAGVIHAFNLPVGGPTTLTAGNVAARLNVASASGSTAVQIPTFATLFPGVSFNAGDPYMPRMAFLRLPAAGVLAISGASGVTLRSGDINLDPSNIPADRLVTALMTSADNWLFT